MYSPRSSSGSLANSWNNRERSSCKHDVDCTFPDRELEIRKENSRNIRSMLGKARTRILGCSIHNHTVYTSHSLLPHIESSFVDVNEQRAFHFSDIYYPQIIVYPRGCAHWVISGRGIQRESFPGGENPFTGRVSIRNVK